MFFYALNMEDTKGVPTVAAVCMEMVNCSNMRVFDVKREGNSPTFFLTGVNNFACYGFGDLRSSSSPTDGFEVFSGCANLIFTPITTQWDTTTTNSPLFIDQQNGLSTYYLPRMASIYKFGTPDDTKMVIPGT